MRILAAVSSALLRPRRLGRGRGLASRRGARTRSGVALLVVLAAILVFTVVVAEMNFGARMRLLMAAHQRDEAKAYWLARSGVNIYRLVLTANASLKNNSYLESIAQVAGVNIGDALWQAVPVISTGLMRMLFVSGGNLQKLDREEVQEVVTTGTSDALVERSRAMSRFDDEGFLDFDGDFTAEIEDEDSKINVNALAQLRSGESLLQNATALELYGLMSGEQNDQWFYDHDIDRWELIGNLADWVDADDTRCGNYSGYEDDLYNRLESPYLSKNAPFDTLEEIRLVAGWEGPVFDRFADHLTVWGSGKINVNTADRELLFGLLKSFGSSPTDDYVEQVIDQLMTYRSIASWQKPQDFLSSLDQLGFTYNEQLKRAISTSSTVFRVTSTGVVSDTTVTITAVLDYSDSSTGKVLYWHVE